MFVQYTLVHIRSYKHSLHRVVDRQCLPRSRHYIPSCSRYQRNPSCKYHNTRSSCCNSLCRPNSFRCIVSHTGLHNSHLCTRHRFQYFFHSSIGFQLSHSYCYKVCHKSLHKIQHYTICRYHYDCIHYTRYCTHCHIYLPTNRVCIRLNTFPWIHHIDLYLCNAQGKQYMFYCLYSYPDHMDNIRVRTGTNQWHYS